MDVGLFSIGGNSAPALRRAVYHGDGWFGFNLLPQEAAPGEKMPQVTLDALQQYRDAGVKQVILRLPTASPDRIDAALEGMTENLIVPAQSL
jgi:hypothetical protein